MLFLLWVMNSVTWPTTFPVHLLWALNKIPPVLKAHCLQGRCPINPSALLKVPLVICYPI